MEEQMFSKLLLARCAAIGLLLGGPQRSGMIPALVDLLQGALRAYGPSSAVALRANDMSMTSSALICPVTQPRRVKKSRSFWMPAAFTAPVTSTAGAYISRTRAAFMLKLFAMVATTSSAPAPAIFPPVIASL